MFPILILLLISIFILLIHLYLDDDKVYVNNKKKYIRKLILTKNNKILKYIIDKEIELNIFDYYIDPDCKQIGMFSDGSKTYLHNPNIRECKCGYKLNINKAKQILEQI